MCLKISNPTEKLSISNLENKLICSDVLIGLGVIPDDTVTNVITSPPYNLKIGYHSAADDQPYADYVAWLAQVFSECYRILRVGGRLIVNIDAMTNRQDDKDVEYVRDIRTDLAIELRKMKFLFYGEHIWYKSNKDPSFNGGQFNGKKTAWGSYCSPSTPAVRRNHEYILVYSKGQFTLPKEEGVSGDPDIVDTDFQNWIASVWYMQPETRKLGKHPVPFPVDLPRRCLQMYSYPNDLVVDPFNGVGTTSLAAVLTKRRYIGIDMDENYCKFAERRIRKEISESQFNDL